jgi:hypothetical protein
MNKLAALIAAGAILGIGGCSAASSTSSAPQSQQTGINSVASSTTAAPPTSTPSSAAAGDVGVCVTPVVSCKGELKTEPRQIIVSGDGTAFVTGLLWTGWGSNGATGSGTLKLDNCNPDCAQGTLTPYAATVVLSDLTGYVGGAAYATMEVAAPGSPFGTRTYHHLAP